MENEIRNRKLTNNNNNKKLIKIIDKQNKTIQSNVGRGGGGGGDSGNDNEIINERVQRVLNDELKKCEISSKNNNSDDDLNILNVKNNNQNKINQNDIDKITKINYNTNNESKLLKISIEFDLITFGIFIVAFITRIYRLSEPNTIVFDELHYGKYVSLYMKNTFFFDQHPPLGKQLVAGIAYLAGYKGDFTFSQIGSEYSKTVPIFWLRFLPALCGSFLPQCVYKLLLQVKLSRWTAILGAFLVIFDNALLTQSRFIIMESMLLTCSMLALLFLLKCHENSTINFKWIFYGVLSAIFFAFTISIKYIGFYTCCLGGIIILQYLWRQLPNNKLTKIKLIGHTVLHWLIFIILPIGIYVGIFYIHLNLLYKAGPHDSIMTSAFQSSLDGGLASITKGQPINVVHGSQITLRHSFGRPCWLHSHAHVYPIRYPDKRGSSHQQQVTCYSYKDVNNWWIVKRPEKADLIVDKKLDIIKHGDLIHLVHGITSRALNSHDVAAAMTPQAQEVSCYIDYNVSMSAQILWKVEIINRNQEGDNWYAIKSQVRLVHLTTGYALKYTGRQLPEWGFNQHEIVADREHVNDNTVWNVEEHRYTKTGDQKERERQLIKAEMIPTKPTLLTFWQKFIELQLKMMWHSDHIQSHMYGSEPMEWPLLNKGIAYWVDKNSNAQIHLIGNIVIWYSGTIGVLVYVTLLVFYLLRRRRLCYDLSNVEWQKFQLVGELFFIGYLLHFLPYFFVERTLFLHHYLPAFLFKLLLLCFVIEHLATIARDILKSKFLLIFHHCFVVVWMIWIIWVYQEFLAISYGIKQMTPDEVLSLRWKDTWDFILHKILP